MSVSLAEIRAAAATIAPHIERTPMLEPWRLGQELGVRLHVKAEALQRTGSYKVRGATYAIAALSPEERAHGIVAMSAGNHAIAVAYAARAHGARAVVAMPETAPRVKIELTRAYGAEIRFASGMTTLLPIVDELKAAGLRAVSPWDDVIPGTGTIGLEIVEDLPDVDLVVVPVGGGGLIAGVATAVRALRPGARIVGVQPRGAAAMRRSLDAGKPIWLEHLDTMADGCAAPSVGARALEIVQRLVADVVIVDEADIARAVRTVAEHVRVIVEPSAACGIAALLTGAAGARPGERVVAILTGSNIDLPRYAALLA